MRILVADDDDIKREHLVGFIRAEFPDASYVEARSYHSALRCLVEAEFDLVFLDMTMPVFDVTPDDTGGRPQAYAGRDILSQMLRRGLRAGVIVVTQFDRFGEGESMMTLQQLDDVLQSRYPRLYLGAVYYDATSSEWRNDLHRAATRVSERRS